MLKSSIICPLYYLYFNVGKFNAFNRSLHDFLTNLGLITLEALFGRPYYRSCLWYSVSFVCLSVCLSVVCDVLYCGKTVRPS